MLYRQKCVVDRLPRGMVPPDFAMITAALMPPPTMHNAHPFLCIDDLLNGLIFRMNLFGLLGVKVVLNPNK